MAPGAATDREIKEFVTAVHSFYLYNSKQVKECARFTGLSFNAVDQAKRYAKGTIATHFRIFCWGAELQGKDLGSFLPTLARISKGHKSSGDLDQLFAEAMKQYSAPELKAWLLLLIAKNDIETRLGIK